MKINMHAHTHTQGCSLVGFGMTHTTHMWLNEHLSPLEVGFPHERLEILILLGEVIVFHAVSRALRVEYQSRIAGG